MESSRRHITAALAIGTMSLVLGSAILHLVRVQCEVPMLHVVLRSPDGTTIRLHLKSLRDDPDTSATARPDTRISVSMRPFTSNYCYGHAFGDSMLSQDIRYAGRPGRTSDHPGFSADAVDAVYFDKGLGLFVYCTYDQPPHDEATVWKRPWTQTIHAYAGPDGISDAPGKEIGRFTSPIYRSWSLDDPHALLTFDKGPSQLFRIDFIARNVTKGPEPNEDDPAVVQIGDKLHMRYGILDVSSGPLSFHRNRAPQMEHPSSTWHTDGTLFVLRESGRIDRHHPNTLEFVATAGFLPSRIGRAKPRDLLAYKVRDLYTSSKTYICTVAAAVSRDGSSLATATFDEEGRLIDRQHEGFSPSRVAYGPLAMSAKYILETLHPPILSIASYLTATSFAATDSYRGIFLLPNSFAAAVRHDAPAGNYTLRSGLLMALLITSPSIILAGLLAWRLHRDARAVGLTKRTRTCWIIATIAFSLVAYITYRLARPKITMVTCENCGKLRRPDMTHCQLCGSAWNIPELTAPAWRVIDTPLHNAPSESDYPASPAVEH